MTGQTFLEWLESQSRDGTFSFTRLQDDPVLTQRFTDGNYEMSEEHFEIISHTGQQIIDYARFHDVDLSRFPDLQAAFGYDGRNFDLTGEELGAFLAGVAMHDNTVFSRNNGLTSDLVSASNQIDSIENRAEQTLAEKLGAQVYGDNNDRFSGAGPQRVETDSPESHNDIIRNPEVPKFGF